MKAKEFSLRLCINIVDSSLLLLQGHSALEGRTAIVDGREVVAGRVSVDLETNRSFFQLLGNFLSNHLNLVHLLISKFRVSVIAL